LTHLKVYAIDDAETVEVDDAVSVEALDDNQTRIWVHIADPTRWVERGSTLDQVAMRRATTLYYPQETVPMFPLDIAAGPMSLGGEACPAMTVRVDVDTAGEILDYEIVPSLIKLDKRYTYDQVDADLKDANGDAALRLLLKVANARDEKRADDGSVTIILPENSIEVKGANASGGDGEVNVTMTCERQDKPARMLVSEMMVLVGDVIGRFGARENIPLPYRGQNEPRLMSDDEWDAIPEGICQDIAMRMSMSPSSSGASPRPHSGLGLNAYVQFTSPIRRYADVVAHQQVKAYLRGESLPYDAESLERVLGEVGTNFSAATRSVRETSKYWAAVYFQSQPSDARWTATVVKFIRGDELVLVVFDTLGFETVVKFDKGAVLGEKVSLKFVDADPHAGNINFARVVDTPAAA
jgi:exoribonuclease-2